MRVRAVAVAATVLGALMPASTQAQTEQVTLDVEPVVRLAGSIIVGCGVRLTGPRGESEVIAELVLADDAIAGREFTLTVYLFPPRPLELAWLTTGGMDTRTLLGAGVKGADGSVSARGALPGLPGSELMRSLMVEGGTLHVIDRNVHPWEAKMPAPVQQRVRAAYLNCAGDLEK